MPNVCHVLRLGKMEYTQAWRLQDRLAGEIASGHRPPALLLLEHPHTYTFGRRGQIENLLWDETELVRRGISVHWVDRGGDVTYHGPGQLVGYPLLPLGIPKFSDGAARLPQADYVGYLRKLEQTLIEAIAQFGLATQRVEGKTGVWVNGAQDQGFGSPERPLKIASIGVKVDGRGVSRHGFALNVNPDMSYWEGIIACGLVDDAMTSLADWLFPVPSMEAVIQATLNGFGRIFGYDMHAHLEG